MNGKIIILFWCFVALWLDSFGQGKNLKPDLSKGNFLMVNRDISLSTEGQRKTVVHLNAKPGPGVAWIKNLAFSKGIIELDIKGKDVLQESFVGIAFHGINDTTYEAVYFRPFNFQSTDSVRHAHAVQYVFLPEFDWSYLRETYPGKYENKLENAVDPTQWFHAKIKIDKNKIEVFVNKDEKPSLVVKPLSDNVTGKIGFWVGNNSDGDFSNFIIKVNE